MDIQFKRVTYKNFLSVGNAPIVIQLDAYDRVLVTGANGSAKSSMLDAIYFALYGRPFRNINKGALVNTVNTKQCWVELQFNVGGHDYVVQRGIKPNTFEVTRDGEPIDKMASVNDQQKEFETSVLGGMTPDVFRQMVVLGSANYVPFMQLPAAKRRDTVESMLDISVFAAMNDIVKARLRDTKSELSTIRVKKSSTEREISSTSEYIARLTIDNADKVAAAKAEVLAAADALKAAADAESAYQPIVPDAKRVDDLLESTQSKIVKLNGDIAVHNSDRRSMVQRKSFFDSHDTCPTCNQRIGTDFKHDHINELERGIADHDDAISKLRADLELAEQAKTKLSAVRNQCASAQRERDRFHANTQRAADNLENKKRSLLAIVNSKSSLSDDMTAKLHALRVELADIVQSELALTYAIAKDDVLASMLKDTGVKARIVDRYIPIINDKINSYLDKLNFYVQFTLDSQFNEKIKSRYRDTFEYNSFSEGEKLRIDISILLAWRDIMRMRSSMSTNLLIMDEILDGAMDHAGVEDFLRVVGGIGGGSNVFIISHRGSQLADKFDSTLEFKKNGNFSEVTQS